jgi:tetratricopeptide (TPR) repeat protein
MKHVEHAARSRLALMLGLLALMSAVAGCVTRSLPRKPWRSYQLGNVHVISGAPQRRSDEVVEMLRKFQVVTAEITTARITQPAVPTRIFVFPDLYMYQALTGSRKTAGRFVPGLAANVIVMDGSQPAFGDELLLHEYTHLIVGTDARIDYPAWYNEGLAEVLSTMRFEGDRIHVGRTPTGVDPAFIVTRWIPLRELFREDYRLRGDPRGQFYPQSWLLVHYAMFGPLEGHADRGAAFEQMLRRLDDGEDPAIAAERAFGMPLQRFEAEVKEYARDGSTPYLTYTASDFAFPRDAVKAAEMAPSSVGAHLALVAAHAGQRDAAIRLAWEAGAAGDASSTRELALAIAETQNRPEIAYQHFERARQIDPRNVEVLALFGWWIGSTAADVVPDEARVRLRKALALGNEATAADPSHGAGHLVVGLAALGLGQDHTSVAVDALTTAHELWPAHDVVTYNLAVALANVDEIDRARKLFERVARRDHNGLFGSHARERLAELERSGEPRG